MASNKFITTNRIGTYNDWLEWESKTDGIIPEGEIIVVQNIKDELNVNPDVEETRIKFGNGEKKFSELPYMDDSLKDHLKKSFLSINSDIKVLKEDYDILIKGPESGEFGTVEYEVADARIGIDEEEPFPKLGDHIRNISSTLNSLSEDLDKFKNADAVSGLYYDDEEYKLYLVDSNGNTIPDSEVTIISGTPGGGGGGPSLAITRLTNKMSSTRLTVINSVPTELAMSFYEKYDGEYTTSNGTLQVEYSQDNKNTWQTLKLSEDVASVPQQLDFYLPIPADILILNQEVYIKVSVIGGDFGEKSNNITYILKAVDGRITCDFKDSLTKKSNTDNSSTIFTNNFTINYTCYGKGLDKTVYFEIDDTIVDSLYIGTSNGASRDQLIEINKFSHGAHTLSIYFKTDQGTKSNVKKFNILYAAPDSRKVILAAKAVEGKDKVIEGNPIEIIYRVYTPNSTSGLTSELTVKVYDQKTTYSTEVLTNINNDVKTYIFNDYKISEGTIYVSFSNKNTLLAEIPIIIVKNNSEYDLNQVSTGLIYSYKSVNINKDSNEKFIYQYPYQFDSSSPATYFKAKNTNFNWISNGFMSDVDTPSDVYLRLMGPAKHTVELPILMSSFIDENNNPIQIDPENAKAIVENGRTIELTFRLSNVSNINAEVIKYMDDDGIGFVVTPVYAALLYKGTTLITDNRTGFIKNEEVTPCVYIQKGKKIRLSIVIEKLDTIENQSAGIYGQCISFYINGEFAQSIPYNYTAGMFTSNSSLVIGDKSCITDLYEVRVHKQSLTPEEILQNYNASFGTNEEKISNLEKNDVLIDDEENGKIGDISYEKSMLKYPCVLITGTMSSNKNDARASSFIFTTPSKDTDGKETYNVEFDLQDLAEDSNGVINYASYNKVQGTSSTKFPVKNYRFYLRKGEEVEETDEETGITRKVVRAKKVKYSLKGYKKDANGEYELDENGKKIALSIPVSTLCWKADYMSSDHANTFNANIADNLFNKDTAAQQTNPLIQNTIYGFRCLVFQRDDKDSAIKFIGDGCLNNDKSTSELFGLDVDGDRGNQTTKQKWEFLNNSEKICTWESDAFLDTDIQDNKYVVKALESMFPDQGDLEDEGLEPDYTALQLAFTWLCQRANYWDETNEELKAQKKEIFKNEFTNHFNKHRIMVYYLFMEFIGLCDNRAKNLFLRTENRLAVKAIRNAGIGEKGEEIPYDQILTELYKDNKGNKINTPNPDIIDWEKSKFAIWMPDLYDLDSGFGVENNGYLHIPYYAEWDYYLYGNDPEKLDYKFNGKNSRLWLMVEDAFKEDLKAQFQTLAQREVFPLNYEGVYKEHIANNALLIAQNIVNKDMITKYSDPWQYGYFNPEKENEDGTIGAYVYDDQYKYIQRGSRTSQKIEFLRGRSAMLYSKYESTKFNSSGNAFTFRIGKNLTGDELVLNLKYSNALYPSCYFGDSKTFIKTEKFIPGDPAVTLKGSNGMNSSDGIYIHGGQYITEINNLSSFYPYEVQLQNMANLKSLYLGSFENQDYENTATNVIKNIRSCQLLEVLDISGYSKLVSADLSENYLLRELYAARTDSLTDIKLAQGGALEKAYIGDTTSINLVELPNLEIFECSGYNNVNSIRIENCPLINALEFLEKETSDNIKLIRKPLTAIRLTGINYEIKNNDISILEDLNNDDYVLGKFMDGNGVSDKDEYKKYYPYLSGKIKYNGDILLEGSVLSSNLFGSLYKKYPDLKITGFGRLENRIKVYTPNNGNWEIYEHQGEVYDKIVNSYGGVGGKLSVYGKLYKSPTQEFEYEYLGLSKDPNNEFPEYYVQLDEENRYITFIDEVYGETELYPIFEPKRRSYTVRFYNGDELLQETSVEYGKTAIFNGNPDLLVKPGDLNNVYQFSHWVPSPENITGERDCYAQYDFTYSNYFEIPITHIDYEIISDTNEDRRIKLVKYTAVPTDIGDDPSADETIAQLKYEYILPHNGEIYKLTETEGCDDPDPDDNIGGFTNSGIKIIDLPEGLEKIGRKTFYNCKELNIINIPESVNSIGELAFANCKNITKVNYNARNLSLDITGSNIHERSPFAYNRNTKGFDIIFGENVEKIPNRLMHPADTTYNIGEYSLREIIFTDSDEKASKCIEIGDYAFNTTLFTNLKLPVSLQKIGKYAFSSNPYMEELDLSNLENLTDIGDYAFSNWKSLKTIKLPKNLEKIGTAAFSGGTSSENNLESIYISGNDRFISLQSTINGNMLPHTLIEKDPITLKQKAILGTKNSILNSNVSIIGKQSFEGIKELKTIDIPNGVELIEEQAFRSCANLENINIGDTVEEIKSSAFTWCRKLKNCNFGKDSILKKIGSQVFFDTAINKLVLPESFNEFTSTYPFANMNNLEILVFKSKTPFTMSTTNIGNNVYSYCLFNNPDKLNSETYPMKKLKVIYVGWSEDEDINKPPQGFDKPWGIPNYLDVKIIYNFNGSDEEAILPEE